MINSTLALKRIVPNIVLALGMLITSLTAFSHNKVVVIPIGSDGGKIYASCKATLDAGASTGDGVYMIDTIGDGITLRAVYCDMATGTTYEAFAFGQYNTSYPGYSLLSGAQWESAPVQAALIWYYNSNDGFDNLDEGFVSGNCCLFATNNETVYFNSSTGRMRPLTGSTICNPAGGYEEGRYHLGTAGTRFAPPLVADFFTTTVPTVTAGCGANDNPGLLVKSYQ